MPFEMNFSDKFKEIMGMVEQNAQQLKKDLTPTPLPSGPDVWEAGRKNGEKMKEEIGKKGAEMATDLLPAGGAVGVVKKVTNLDDYVKELYQTKLDATEYKSLLDKIHKQAFQGYEAGQHSFDQADQIYDKLYEKYSGRLKALYRKEVPQLSPSRAKPIKPEVEDFFGMHKSTDLGDIVLTRSAKDPSKFQMTFFEGKLGSSNTVKDEQFDTMEDAVKAFRETQ